MATVQCPLCRGSGRVDAQKESHRLPDGSEVTVLQDQPCWLCREKKTVEEVSK